MKALNKEKARDWCRQRFVEVSGNDFLYFNDDERHCLAVELPEKPYNLVTLADYLLPYSQDVPFHGALLWIRQWGVRGDHEERVGLRVIEAIRRMHGETTPLDESPGLLFGSDELVDAQVCLVQPLLVGWDAFLVPESGEYVVATSHDEITCVLSRTAETHAKMHGLLQPWNPKEEQDWYFRGIEIPT